MPHTGPDDELERHVVGAERLAFSFPFPLSEAALRRQHLRPRGGGMSYNTNRDPVGGSFRDDAAARGRGPACGAGELRGMLQRIADHIAQSDKRQQAVLHDMQSRLFRFAEDAQPARVAVPPELATAFARIEEGINRLNQRFENESGACTNSFSSDRQAVHGTHASHDQHHNLHGSVRTGAPSPQFATIPPDALGVAAPYNDGEDGYWDRASAEALTRVYEPERMAGHQTVPPSQIPAFDPAVASRDTTDGISRDSWAEGRAADRMEQRFAEIAARIEQMLVGMRPESSILALEARLDSFEEKMDSALARLATRADVEKLKAVEAHLRELAQQFDRARSNFGRLENIEAHLRLLIEQISDHRFSRLLEQHALSESHIARIAVAVAQRMEERQFQHADPKLSMDRLIELRELIEKFLEGQRHERESTNGALTTIQQAILNLLERMDTLEQVHSPVAVTGEQDVRPGYPERESFGLDMGRSVVGAASATRSLVAEVQPVHTGHTETENSEPMESVVNDGAGEGRTTAAVTQINREDFLAAARRAARKASSQDPGEEPSRAAMRTRGTSGGRRRAAGSRPVTGLVVATLAVVLAVGIGLTTYSIYKEATKYPAGTIERSLPAPEGSGLAPDSTGAEVEPAGDADRRELSPSREASGRPADSETEATQEFVIDDLPVVPAPPSREEEAQGKRALTQLPSGIILDNGTVATSEDIARAQQQRAIAQLSSSLGAAQAGTMSLPAALIPQSQESAASTSQPSAQSSAANRVLPPATIGPLSLRLAAANGDPAAEYEVAVRFAEGKGVKQDMKEAVKWLQRSAARGHAPAQYRLGTLYERGLGVTADRGRAMAWYRSAAEKGDVKAMHNLAVLSASGNPANYRTAAYWFAEAAERGLGDSQYNLAVLYETGRGVDRDLKQAFKWFALAARNGDKEAMRRRDRVKLMLDAQQLEIAEGLVRAWKPTTTGQSVQQSRSQPSSSGRSA